MGLSLGFQGWEMTPDEAASGREARVRGLEQAHKQVRRRAAIGVDAVFEIGQADSIDRLRRANRGGSRRLAGRGPGGFLARGRHMLVALAVAAAERLGEFILGDAAV